MQKNFFKNIVFLLFLNLLIKPFWLLGVDREVQNIVGNQEYGIFFSIYNFAYLFYILLDLGITNFNNRNIAQNNHLLSKHFVGISQVKLFLSLLYAVVIFLVGWIIGYRGRELELLAWCGLNQILLSFILYLRSNISGLLLFKTDSFLSVFDRVIAICICSFLIWSGVVPRHEFNILWYVYAQTFAYGCTVLLALFIVIRHAGRLTFRVNMPFFIMILKKSFPYALLVLLMSFYNRLEPVLLERLLDDGGYQAGVYGCAFRLLDAGNNISYLFSVILLPLFAAIIKKGEDISDLVRQSFTFIIAMTGIAAVLCICYSEEIMRLMYTINESETPAHYEERIGQTSLVLSILMGSFVAVSTTYIFGTLLTANGNLKHLNIVAACGVVINLGLNFIFIPSFQSVGAACTSLSVQVVTAVIQFFIAKKIFHFDLGRHFGWHLLLFFALVISSTFVISQLPLMWLYRMIISLIVSIIFLFITKLLTLKELLVFVPRHEKNVKQ